MQPSNVNVFEVGDRVQLIPLKHKGKLATVRYFGPIAKKFGSWVGLELEDDTGDSNGTINGEVFFTCAENFGLFLRNSQVRTFDGKVTATVKKSLVPSLQEGLLRMAEEKKETAEVGDSPLITPKDDSHKKTVRDYEAKLMSRLEHAFEDKPVDSEDKLRKSESLQQALDKGDKKNQGWKERLERLRNERTTAKDQSKTAPKTEEEKVREAFAPATGIQRDEKGALKVNQEKVPEKLSAEEILKQQILDEAKVGELKKSVVQPKPTVQNSAVPQKATSIADRRNELKNKKEEVEKSRQSLKESFTGSTTPAPSTGVAATRSGAQRKPEVTSITRMSAPQSRNIGSAATQEPNSATGSKTSYLTNVKKPEPSKVSSFINKPNERVPSNAPAARNPISAAATQRENKTPLRNAMASNVASRVGAKADVSPTPNKTPVRMPATAANRTGTTPQKQLVRNKSSLLEPSGLATARGPTNNKQSMIELAGPEVKKLEAQLYQKQEEIMSQNDQISLLHAQIEALNEEQVAARKQFQEQQKEISAMKRRVEAQAETGEQPDSEAAALKEAGYLSEIEELKSLLEAAQQAEAPVVVEQIDTTSPKLVEEYERQLTDLKKKLAEAQVQQTLPVEVDSSENLKLTALQEELELLKRALKDSQAKLEILELEKEELALTLEEVRENFKTESELQRSQIATLQTQLDSKNASQSDQSEFKSDFEKKLQAISEENAKIKTDSQKEIASFATEKSKLERLLKEEEERRKDELEILQLEMDALQDEKNELLKKFSEVDDVDPLKDLGIDEVKHQNQKLRQAIASLTWGFEEERKRLEAKAKDESLKDKIIKEQNEKLKEMDFLLEEVELKEGERKEMENKLEEIVEYENMVEEMVQEIAEKEELIDQMEVRISELTEEHDLQEELNDNLEKYNHELQEDLAKKETEVKAVKMELEQLETIVIEQDGMSAKYKDRASELQNQIVLLTEQLKSSIGGGEQSQVSVMLEKQQALIQKLREADKRQLTVSNSLVAFWQGKAKINLIERIMPETLVEETKLEHFKKVQALSTAKHKATLLIRDICEVQLVTASTLYGNVESAQLNQFLRTLLSISQQCERLVSMASVIHFQVSNMSPKQYDEVMKQISWDYFVKAAGVIDYLAKLLKEQSLAHNFQATDLDACINELATLQKNVQNAFVRKSPEEKDDPKTTNADIEQQRRKNMAQRCAKLSVREQSMKLAIAVCFCAKLQSVSGESDAEETKALQAKAVLIYQRLLETVLQLDHIPNLTTGDDYLDLEKLGTELRMTQKFDNLKAIWEGSEEDMNSALKKSWLSTYEAVERDITQLNNDFKFKKLIKIVSEKSTELSRKLEFDDLYTLDEKSEGPWSTIADLIRSELADMSSLKLKNSALAEKQKELTMQMISLKKDKDEGALIYATINEKLSQALAKAEMVPALQIENNDFNARIEKVRKEGEAFKDQFNKTKIALDATKKALDDALKNQATAVQKAAASAAEGAASGMRPNIRARNPLLSTRSTALGAQGHARKESTSGTKPQNADQILQQLNLQEDVYSGIVNKLQLDRLQLKNRHLHERLHKLSVQEDSAFNMLLKEVKHEKSVLNGNVKVKLNKTDQQVIETAITQVDSLKLRYRRKLAQARVVDYTKTVPIEENALTQKSGNESFNYLIMQTKQQVNDAMELLFAKDSSLRRLKPTKTDLAEAESATSVCVGELKLRSKVQIPQRRVVLDDDSLRELRRNLALFQN